MRTLVVVFMLATACLAAPEHDAKSDADWQKAYEQLLEKDPGVLEKIESGGTTKEEVIQWLKDRGGKNGKNVKTGQDSPKKPNTKAGASTFTDKASLALFRAKLRELSEAGKLSQAETRELYRIMAGPVAQENRGEKQLDGGKRPVDLKALGARLTAAVKDGKMSVADAKAQYVKYARAAGQKGKAKGKANGKGRGKKAGGVDNFYAIVVGRLKSKDIELGEFTLAVDHVTSMYRSRWVKDEIIGKTVKVTGVSGEFRDNLLLIKRGETLKFRSGGYKSDSKTLLFGYKFHVLERTAPFDPDAFGIPPKNFRGFQGVVQGKIAELGGFEVLLRVKDVVKVSDNNRATDAHSIQGKLVRLTGFFQHQALYNDLHQGDTIRVGVSHADPTHDELGVTEVLEKVEK